MKRIYGLLLAMLMLAGSATAKSWTIYFGGAGTSSALTFSPNSLNVNVGDTIVFQGNFNPGGSPLHTATSTSVPQGAATFNYTSGTSAMYIVTVAGPYNYQCNFHVLSGMTGSFVAAAAGVVSSPQINMIMEPIYPNPTRDEAMVMFTLDKPARVTLRVYNALGDLVQTPTNEDMSAGDHMLMLDTKSFSAGTYQYVLQAGDAILQRNEIVVK